MQLRTCLLLAMVLSTAPAKLTGSLSGTNSRRRPSDKALSVLDDEEEDIDDDIYRTDSTGCPVPFGGRCLCHMSTYQRHEKYVVNCTNTGFTDAECLSALPDNAEVLIFTGNFIDSLPPNTFGTESNFENLETIDLSNNGIKEIDGQSFHRVANVKTLILNHNSLYIVDSNHHPRVFSNFINLESLHLTNAFTEEVDSNWYLISLEIIFQSSMLTRLKKLHLEQNEIWNFGDSRTFCDLPALQHLYLGNNRLTGIQLDLICLKDLSYLDLEYNSIRRLDGNATALLDQLAARTSNFAVKLTGNPFVCDCKIQPLYDWLMTTNTRVMGHSEYRCFDGHPSTNKHAPIMQLRNMECAPKPAPESRTSASSVVLGLAVFAACVVLGVVIFRQRRRLLAGAAAVPPQLQTAIQSVKRARQYTSIEPEEATQEVQV